MNDENVYRTSDFLELAVARDQFAEQLRASNANLSPFIEGLPPFEQKLLLSELLRLQFQHRAPSPEEVDALKRQFAPHAEVIQSVWRKFQGAPDERETRSFSDPDTCR